MNINCLKNHNIKNLVAGALVCMNLAVFSSSHAGEEVTVQHDDLRLNANLEMADGKDFSDGIVMIVHGHLAHNKMEIITAVQQTLMDNEISSLAINLSLSVDNRHGFFDCLSPHRHKQEDSVTEIAAWVEWLQQKGTEEIVLMGHSRGANQALVYATERPSSSISHVVLLAPGAGFTARGREAYEARYELKVDDVIDSAETLIKAGKGDELMKADFAGCPQARITPNSFLSYYNKTSKFSNPELIMNLSSIPTLLILGDQDDLQPNAAAILDSAIGNEKVQMEIIEGAGHFFRDLNMEDAIDLAVEFIATET